MRRVDLQDDRPSLADADEFDAELWAPIPRSIDERIAKGLQDDCPTRNGNATCLAETWRLRNFLWE